ncbi:putative oxidoreductase YciK [Zhongshania aliphaticivorans]|uniref:Putative oxidoreductase YciK n=1 Tax=Zhongshania aliphaticivorans TaxID=1470434 RepID=A0A5S9MNV3_9GAMM|nr:putative oxidoreductase YciK [Zhongshania aliphaticivorans]CAA0086792.1 putative oxidoreductase YciK [Zhongshania aliphaticivorans]
MPLTLPQDFTATPQCLAGKVILVTGAGDGIGRAAALSYAQHGATVILLGRTIDKLEAVYDEIEAAKLPQAAIYPMHLRGAAMKDYEDLANTIEKEFGHLDGLLHNAGVLGERRTLAQTSVDSWDEVLQVNLSAPFMMTQALLPLLAAAKNASVIFTSSSVGRKGRAFWGAYAISKFGTEGMMQVLADEEFALNQTRVNSINPGATQTVMRRTAYPGENPQDNPLPEAIMPLYLYLMSDDSNAVNGQQFDAQAK